MARWAVTVLAAAPFLTVSWADLEADKAALLQFTSEDAAGEDLDLDEELAALGEVFPGWKVNVTDPAFAKLLAEADEDHPPRFLRQEWVEEKNEPLGLSEHFARTLWQVAKDANCREAMGGILGIFNFLQVGLSFHYGNYCGISESYAFGNKTGDEQQQTSGDQNQQCGPYGQPSRDILLHGENHTVCDDSGMDACCAAHDHGSVYLDTKALGYNVRIHECGVNNRLLRCTKASSGKKERLGLRGEGERRAQVGAMCAFSHMPCVAAETQKTWTLVWPTYAKVSVPPELPCTHHKCYSKDEDTKMIQDKDIDLYLTNMRIKESQKGHDMFERMRALKKQRAERARLFRKSQTKRAQGW